MRLARLVRLLVATCALASATPQLPARPVEVVALVERAPSGDAVAPAIADRPARPSIERAPVAAPWARSDSSRRPLWLTKRALLL